MEQEQEQEQEWGLTHQRAGLVLSMMRQMLLGALFAGIATGALFLTGCSTVGSRIDENRAAFQQLPPKEQALVNQGQISGGMSQQAVYIAWGQPQQKASALVKGVPTETWVYTLTTGAYGPAGYGGFQGYGGFGYAGRLGFYGRHGRYRYYGSFVDPFWDPFYYPFPATVSYPVKTVSFQRGRVVAFQLLRPGGY